MNSMNFLLNPTKVSKFCWSIHAWVCQQPSGTFLTLQTFLQAILHLLQIYSGSLRALGFGLHWGLQDLISLHAFFDEDFTIKYDLWICYSCFVGSILSMHLVKSFVSHYFIIFPPLFIKPANSKTLQIPALRHMNYQITPAEMFRKYC